MVGHGWDVETLWNHTNTAVGQTWRWCSTSPSWGPNTTLKDSAEVKTPAIRNSMWRYTRLGPACGQDSRDRVTWPREPQQFGQKAQPGGWKKGQWTHCGSLLKADSKCLFKPLQEPVPLSPRQAAETRQNWEIKYGFYGGLEGKCAPCRATPTPNIQKGGSFGDPSGSSGCRSQNLNTLSLRTAD